MCRRQRRIIIARHSRVLQAVNTYVRRHRSTTIRPHQERGMERRCVDTGSHSMCQTAQVSSQGTSEVSNTKNRQRRNGQGLSTNATSHGCITIRRWCSVVSGAGGRGGKTHLLRKQDVHQRTKELERDRKRTMDADALCMRAL